MKRALIFISLLLFAATAAFAQAAATGSNAKPLPTIAEKTAGMEKLPGFFNY